MKEAVDMLAKESAAEKERGGYAGPVRIYTSNIGQFSQLAFEMEYEDLAAFEKMWTQWGARPTSADWMKKWLELHIPGGSNEIWNLVE
jgi:hypothetical protein